MVDRELIFIVEESDEGGYLARAIGESIFTEADSAVELKQNIIDAVKCNFGETIPNHTDIRIGTVNAIMSDVAAYLQISKEEIIPNTPLKMPR